VKRRKKKANSDAAGVAATVAAVEQGDLAEGITVPEREKRERPRADLVLVPVKDITVQANARTRMDEGLLANLEASIRSLGLMEPVIVHKRGAAFVMIAGHRRLEAAKRAGEDLIEAKVYHDLDDQLAVRMQLTENLQREDLNHIDVAMALGRATKAGLMVPQIAAQINASDDYVRKHLNLLRLCAPVRELVASGRLPVKQAELLTLVGDDKGQIDLAGSAVEMKYSTGKNPGWKHDKPWGGKPGDPQDYVMPAAKLRDMVSWRLKGLAAGGWPLDKPYAGQRACAGCPDNSETRADDAMLFEGVRPQHSNRKGYCGDGTCYAKKLRLREKDLTKKRAEAKKAKAKKIAKAKRAGLAVCPACSRILDEKEKLAKSPVSGEKACPKCVAKDQKKADRGYGGNYEEQRKAREKKLAVMKKAFPGTPGQRYAVALWNYGSKSMAAVRSFVVAGDLPPDAAVIAARLGIAFGVDHSGWGTQLNKDRKALAAELAKPDVSLSPKQLAQYLPVDRDLDRRPRVEEYSCEIAGVPLTSRTLSAITLTEALAGRWGVELPPRPQKRAFAKPPAAAKKTTAQRFAAERKAAKAAAKRKAGKAKTEKAKKGVCRACGCTQAKACPGGCSWRDRPKNTLCSKCDPQALFANIVAGDKDFSASSVQCCRSVHVLEAAQDFGLKESWHRTAVKKRLAELKAQTPAGDGKKSVGQILAETDLFCTRQCDDCSIGCAMPGDRHERMRFAIEKGKKAEGLPAIERCTDAAFLTKALQIGKGDWRRKAIRDRILGLDEEMSEDKDT